MGFCYVDIWQKNKITSEKILSETKCVGTFKNKHVDLICITIDNLIKKIVNYFILHDFSLVTQ